MLAKLQRQTLNPIQLIGYAITILIGVSILFVTIQLYLDVQPILAEQSDVFSNNSAVISKKVSVFKSMNKEKIYFTKDELDELNSQTFVKDVSKFSTATFKINAFTDETGNIPSFYTDMFFESIPDKYLDVQPKDWEWTEDKNFIPIIIPEDYLNLYNFGFAESQGLPVLSKNTISTVTFNVEVSGKGKKKVFRSKIVGFSNKINSILVPLNFMDWANENYGSTGESKTSRLLIEFVNPSDEGILAYFNDRSYSIGEDKLEFSKLLFFFKTALFFVFLIAMVIIIISIAFILMSINLIIQKNNTLMTNLYQIGYDHKTIAKYYQKVISLVTIVSLILAVILSVVVRNMYLKKLQTLFDFDPSGGAVLWMSIILGIVLLLVYNFQLLKNVKKVVVPHRY